MYYHIWFVTKYRKTTLCGETAQMVKHIFLEVANNKKYNIMEMETNRDHVHMLLEVKDKNELAETVRTLKAISAKKVLDAAKHRDVGNRRHFWARRYGYRDIDPSEIANIRKYIRNQQKIPHA